MEDIKKPKQKVLSKFTCDECGEKVEETELVIPVGPRKGETIVANYGCKCADIKLAEQAMKLRAEIRNNKMKRSFDYYSLVNESLQQVTLANYEPTSEQLANAKQLIEQFVNEFNGRNNLLLHGSFGTGESHLSVSVTKELMEKGYECLFLSLPKLLTKIKDTYNNKGITEDELLEVIQRVDLLVLDDIGAEDKTDWTVWENASNVKRKSFTITEVCFAKIASRIFSTPRKMKTRAHFRKRKILHDRHKMRRSKSRGGAKKDC